MVLYRSSFLMLTTRVCVRFYRFKNTVRNTTYPHFRCQLQVQGFPGHHISLIGYNPKSSHDRLLGLMICWDNLQNSRKCYTYNYSFITKNTNQDQPSEEKYKVRSRRVPNASVPFPHRFGVCHPLGTSVCVQPGSFTKFPCPEFLLGFYYFICIIGWIIGHNIQPPVFPPQRWLKISTL